DGTAASVFAIKQFAYLFPEFADNRTVMIHINKKGEARLPEEVSIGELVSRHFNDLTMIHLKADPQKYFISWLMENKSAIVVSGAFSRSAFSEFFKKSFVTKAIEEHHFPLFIAHN
ncbi:MAG: hypothetical protein JST10_08135, partial [Bacteroidetes bacterium]|nr:hypothetical protein [Bacteroidota bacterium]